MFITSIYLCRDCSSTDDIENQKALRLAQTVDPHGRRTIGNPLAFVCGLV
jgi:hypothetical protein